MDRSDPSTKDTVRRHSIIPESEYLFDLQTLSGLGLRQDISMLGRGLRSLWHKPEAQPATDPNWRGPGRG